MTDNREKWQQGLRDALDSSSGAEPDLLWASLAPQAAQAADRLRRAHKRKLLWGSVAGTAFAAAAIAAVVLIVRIIRRRSIALLQSQAVGCTWRIFPIVRERRL